MLRTPTSRPQGGSPSASVAVCRMRVSLRVPLASTRLTVHCRFKHFSLWAAIFFLRGLPCSKHALQCWKAVWKSVQPQLVEHDHRDERRLRHVSNLCNEGVTVDYADERRLCDVPRVTDTSSRSNRHKHTPHCSATTTAPGVRGPTWGTSRRSRR